MEISEKNGWMTWDYAPRSWDPKGQLPIQTIRCGCMMHVIRVADMNPATNIAGLYWRPTGIYRELAQ